MKILFIVCLLFPFILPAQGLPIKEGEVFYEFVDSVAGMSQNEIYNKAKTWVATNFKNPDAVRNFEIQESGEFIGKGNTIFFLTDKKMDSGFRLHYTFRITAKDDKYRLQIYGHQFSSNYFNQVYPISTYKRNIAKKYHVKFVERINENAEYIRESLYKTVTGEAVSDF